MSVASSDSLPDSSRDFGHLSKESESPFEWADLANVFEHLFHMAMLNEIKELLLTDKQITNVPIPQFNGKKGEVPEVHLYKVDDYFTNFKIEAEADMLKGF